MFSVISIAEIAAVVYLSPVFIIPAIAVAAIGAGIAEVYITAQLPIKRYVSCGI